MKVAIPTNDGVRVAARFGRTSRFVVADVGLGQIAKVQNRLTATVRRPGDLPRRAPQQRDPRRSVADLLSDCRVVITGAIGDSMRRTLTRQGMEIVVTSEELVDRALALFALAVLKDESRMDPDDTDLPDLSGSAEDWDAADEFDA